MVAGQSFEIVFVDPPYAMYDSAMPALESAVAALPVKGLIVVEHRTVQKFGERWAGGALLDRRKYGGTTVRVFEH